MIGGFLGGLKQGEGKLSIERQGESGAAQQNCLIQSLSIWARGKAAPP